MKKRRIIGISLSLLIGLSIIGIKNYHSVSIAYAEEDSSLVAEFEEKTYYYEHLTITLLNESECLIEDTQNKDSLKTTYAIIDGLLYVFNPQNHEEYLCFTINEDASLSKYEIKTNEESDGFYKETISKINSFKDTYLVPLLSGVSLASILSAIMSLVIAYLNRKTNNKNKISIDNLIVSVTDIISNTTSLINELNKQNLISNNIKTAFEVSTSDLLKKIELLTDKAESIEAYKDVLISLSAIITNFISNNAECVKNGVARDVNKINEQIKQLK